MSRIGKLPISLPKGVSIERKGDVVTVKGPKGELSQKIDPKVGIDVEDAVLRVSAGGTTKQDNALHGLYRALLNNMVTGVSEGFSKTLELIGVGYRATSTGNTLELSLGYTHTIFLLLPPEVKVEAKMERNKNPLIILESCDKQLLGQVCAKIRSFRKPEPYKGKGIRFLGEYVRRKSGKTAAK